MIENIGSYQISDFILFSREVYLATIASYNAGIWPVQVAWVLASVLLLYSTGLKRRDHWSRLASFILAAAWLFVGWIFHLKYFSPINWAAEYFAWIFFVEAGLFFVFGTLLGQLHFDRKKSFIRNLGIVLMILYGFGPLDWLSVQSVETIMLFGWGGEATALASIGALLLCRLSWTQVLLLIPALSWCLIAALMHYGLNAT